LRTRAACSGLLCYALR